MMRCKRVIGCMLVSAVLVSGLGYTKTFAETEQTNNDAIVDEETEEETEDIETEDVECKEGEEEKIEESDDIKVTTRITSRWEKHYNMEVTITNVSDTRVDDWEMSFDFKNQIEHIWNAKISDYNEDFYTVKNVDWNQDIEMGKSVTFGMTVSYQDKIESMENCYLTRIRLKAEIDYDVKYQEYNRTGDKVNGQIIITNKSNRRIEDWKLGLTSNISFQQVWNADYYVEEGEDCLDNKGYNQNIEPGQSVSFGFIGICGNENVELNDYTLYEMVTIPEDMEGDPDWEGEYMQEQMAYAELYRDDFDSEEAYQAYVEKRKELGLEIPEMEIEDDENIEYEDYPAMEDVDFSPYATLQSVTKKKRTGLRLNKGAVEAKFVNTGGKGIQSYYKSGDYMYVTRRYGEKIIITKCPKSKIKASTKEANAVSQSLRNAYDIKTGDVVYDLKNPKNETMTLVGFQHGQTLEMFTYGSGKSKKTYIMVTAGAVKTKDKNGKYVPTWGDKIAFLTFKRGTYSYGEGKLERQLSTMYLTNSQYANRTKKYTGTVYHIEAALSEDKKTLLLWTQVQKKGKRIRFNSLV